MRIILQVNHKKKLAIASWRFGVIQAFAHFSDGSKIAVVGVHIRLTDYAHHLDVLWSLKLVGFDYIVRAMDIFKDMLKDKV